MDVRNDRQTVIITGAYGGIGYDLAQGFLRRGDNVVLSGRDHVKLRAAAERLDQPRHIVLVAGDIGEKTTGERLAGAAVESFGGVDVLVNNAGIFYAKPFLESTAHDLESFFHTNLKGTYLTSQAVAREMIVRARGGAIINIGTVLVDHAMSGLPVSAAMTAKGGIHALTVSLAAELAPYRIRVNTVAPGVIRTPIHGDADVDAYSGIHPLNRIGEVGEITDTVIYLASATYTTGATLAVDGGYRVGRL